MKTILLQAPNFLGDEVVFTGVVREMKQETGWRLMVKTNAPLLWRGHPDVEAVNPSELPPGTLVVPHHHCPHFRQMGQVPVHYLEKYVQDVREALGLTGRPHVRRFAGEVPVTEDEASSPPLGLNTRYWVIAAGCKTNVPVKGWGVKQYQEVVDALRGRVLFVQAGSSKEWHPPLRGVVDAVGKTSLRDLIRLIHHAEGVLCPITSLMHLAAAVPVAKSSPFPMRPCVVIGGGREDVHFIQYPMHRVLNTIGMLSCCAKGGCGKSRFGEGQCQYPESIGEGMVIPRCMSLIKPADVVAAVEFYYRGMAKLPRGFGRVQAVFRHLQRGHGQAHSISGAEIGVLKGEMSSQLLLGNLNLHLTMVDRWQRALGDPADPTFYEQPQRFFDEAKKQALASTEFATERRKVLAKPSVEAAHEVPDASLDFAFIDADHSYEGCKTDIEVWYPKLKPGGILCGHDYDRPKWPKEGVKRAVQEFASQHQFTIETDKDNTWFIHLPQEYSSGLSSHFRP